MIFSTSEILLSISPTDVLHRVERHFAGLVRPVLVREIEFAELRWRIRENGFTLKCSRVDMATVLGTVVVVPTKSGSKAVVEVRLTHWTSFAPWAIGMFIPLCWALFSFFNNFVEYTEYSSGMQYGLNGLAVFFLAIIAFWIWSTRRRPKPTAKFVHDYIDLVLRGGANGTTWRKELCLEVTVMNACNTAVAGGRV